MTITMGREIFGFVYINTQAYPSVNHVMSTRPYTDLLSQLSIGVITDSNRSKGGKDKKIYDGVQGL
jgi:hypothetical protein